MLDTGGAGLGSLRSGLSDAFPGEFSSRGFPELNLGGATDGSLVEFLFEVYSIENNGNNQALFYRCYLERLADSLEKARREKSGRRMPGVNQLVNQFAEAGHELGLLTGNIREAAYMKLDAFGFEGHLFRTGAFGDDHSDRNELGHVAIRRAEKICERKFSVETEVLIIGDTVKDIACARACGAQVAAVATGACPYDILAKEEPDYLFRDFSDPEEILETIL